MLALGRFEVNRTHTVEVAAPLCVIEVKLTDPRDGSIVSIRAGAKVRLVREDGTRTPFMGETDDDGFVMFAVTEALENVAVEIDFDGHEFLDLDEEEFVSAKDVAPIDKRPLLRMPNVWRSDLEPEVFDAIDGRFAKGRLATLEIDGQGTEVTPWEIRIDHAWQSLNVAFEYYDTVASAVVRLDRGGVLEAFEGTSFGAATLVGATILEDGHNLRLLRLFRRVDPANLCLRVRMPEGAFVDLNEGFGPNRVNEPDASASTLPMSAQLERYALPSLWLSRGQFATTASNDSKRRFEQAVGDVVGTDEALTFDLDDVLLVDKKRIPIAIKKPIPVTVFGRDFSIKDPDSSEPQHSKHDIDEAHLRGRDAYYDHTTADDGDVKPYVVTRVIRRGRKLYDLDGSRTSSGKVIGVRAAIRDAHPVVHKAEKKLDGTINFRGEIHYFRDVGFVNIDEPSAEYRLGVALVFISVRLRKMRPSVDDANLAKARASLHEAARRWTGQPLEDPFGGFVPEHPDVYRITQGQHATKFVFHFPSVEGKAQINCFLHKPRKKSAKQYEDDKKSNPKPDEHRPFRAHAALHHIALNVHTDLEDKKGGGLESVTAHELGHIMGLPDEYLESIDQERLTIPRHNQSSHITHFAFQGSSMMKGDIMPMLRHYWHLSSLVANDARIPQGSATIYANTQEPEDSGPHARIHHYSMPPTHPSPFKPFTTVKMGPSTKRYEARVGLLGDDFDADDVSRRCTANLLVDPKLSIKMRGFGLSIEDRRERDKTLRSFAKSLTKRFNEEHLALVLKSTDSPFVKKHLSRIYISFTPRFSRRNRLQSDIRIRMEHAESQPAPAPKPEIFEGKEFRINEQTPPVRVVRAILGLDASATHDPAIEVVWHSGGSVTFEVEGKSIQLRATDRAALKKNEFRYAIQDKPGILEELPLETIADNIAAAINLKTNGFFSFVRATVKGTTIALTQLGPPFHITTLNSNYRITNRYLDTITPEDLAPLAQEVGKTLGATYEVIRVSVGG